MIFIKACLASLFYYYLVSASVNAVPTLQSTHEPTALQMRDNQASNADVSIYELAFKPAFSDHDADN